LANVDRFSKSFRCQIPEETLYVTLQCLLPQLSCVAAVPCKNAEV